jgi:hypothetical protein
MRCDRQQAALSFHHNAARLGKRRADQRNARGGIAFGDAAHPFRAGPGLAEAASRHDQPYAPVFSGRKLAGMRP